MFKDVQKRLFAEKSITIAVRVRPNASTSAAKGIMADGTLKIDLHAPAEDGKANAELVKFLAKELGVDRSNVEILSGQMNRRKIVRLVS